ncbi:hypothetical protein [Nocardiopsis coralliicola]
MLIFVLTAALVLAGLAFGFLLAVSIGIRRSDRRGGYRSLRDDSDTGRLALSGQRVCGLGFRDADPALATAAKTARTLETL